jgi:O-antigen ligase
MFLEKPFVGWGPTANTTELANRLGYRGEQRDTHNDILWALTATGLAGGVFFIGGQWLCAWGAWKGRRGSFGPFPFALMLAVLVMGSSGTFQKVKATWIIAAIAVASGASATGSRASKAVRQPAQGYLRS